jgi:hypothetical protein
MSSQATLERYYARLDGDDPGDPLELVADDLRFAITVPGASYSGGRADLRAYVEGRGPTRRRHYIVHAARAGALEHLIGEVREDGHVNGSFLAAAEFDGAGRIRRYLVTMGTADLDLTA